MIIIGEKINTSIKSMERAVKAKDAEVIQDMALRQAEAGAHYIDVNCGTFSQREPELLVWLVNKVQEVVDLPLCIDSPNPEALEPALKAYKGRNPMINSVTAEKKRFETVFPLVKEFNTSIIALCMDDKGMPETADERLKIADRLINAMVREGLDISRIFIDPMVRPISTGTHYGVLALETIRRVMDEFPGVHTICGLSNISFGLPARKLINRTFLVSAIAAGLDSAILDPLDKKLMGLVFSAELIQGRDEYCMNFLQAYRDEKLDLD
ncbi:MAG: methyltetrahydrofolate cobalamin methyltransferase [Caldicoprobacterales bacterium]